jgi:hypothetical protein
MCIISCWGRLNALCLIIQSLMACSFRLECFMWIIWLDMIYLFSAILDSLRIRSTSLLRRDLHLSVNRFGSNFNRLWV